MGVTVFTSDNDMLCKPHMDMIFIHSYLNTQKAL